MLDQAATLRQMAHARQRPAADGVDTGPRPRVIVVTSGKGGVGKTNVVANLAIALAQMGRRVTIFDADLSLANVDVLLGLNPQYHLGHVLAGSRELAEVVMEGPSGIQLLPGSSGLEELAELTAAQRAILAGGLRDFEVSNDFILIDTPAGIGSGVTGLLRAADEAVIVTTPEPTAVIDAYATIKVVARHAPGKRTHILINEVQNARDAQQVFNQLAGVAHRFLDHELTYLGLIVGDEAVPRAVKQQEPFIKAFPEAPASRCVRIIAKRLQSPANQAADEPDPEAGSFWGRLFGWKE